MKKPVGRQQNDVPTFDGLRLGLLSAHNRNADALLVISAVSHVSQAKIKRFMDGDDSALTLIERTALEILM